MEIKSIITSGDRFGILVDETLHITKLFFDLKGSIFGDSYIADGQTEAHYQCLGSCCIDPGSFKKLIAQAVVLGAKRISYKNGLQISYENNWENAGEIHGLPFENVPPDKRGAG